MSKMAAKSKKRLSEPKNKLIILEKIELKDVICTICQSILIEPVTLPCFHNFCQHCFNGSIENNALCCPLCRLRMGSWLRSATKQKNLVNEKLWDHIKSNFSQEIDKKVRGEDINLPEEKALLRLSAPGEIRQEYESELKRLRVERLKLEQKHLEETELLIKKLQNEEELANKKYLDSLKQDEILAKQIQKEIVDSASLPMSTDGIKPVLTRSKLRSRKIDSYLSKLSPLPTDDTTSTSCIPKAVSTQSNSGPSPEIIPNYGKLLRSFLDKNIKNGFGIWNKENGGCIETQVEDSQVVKKTKDVPDDNTTVKSKNVIQSLLVSLPLPHTGILKHKTISLDNRNIETGSADSMQQELCYFKPIEGSTPTGFSSKTFPLRVPGVRAQKESSDVQNKATPSRDQYIEGLCQLRKLSLAQKLPSAFVIALSMLRVNKDSPVKNLRSVKSKNKTYVASCVTPVESITKKHNLSKNKEVYVDGIIKLNKEKTLRRTRSMGSISKNENETTPKKKIKEIKFCSEKKIYLRSNSKKSCNKREVSSPPAVTEIINNNMINLAVKNLSSPLENCDMKNILCEQLQIEKMIEQEKKDFELAQKMQAEWNGRRQLRRTATKRQVTLNYALRPAKKLKV